MKNDRKREIIDSLKEEMEQDQFSFDDLMSKREKRKRKQEKKFEEKIIKELEVKKEKRRQKELEETQKLEKGKIKEALKKIETEPSHNSHGENAPKVTTIESSYVSRSNNKNTKQKKEVNTFTKILLGLTAIGILVFWGFNIVTSFDRVNHIYTIVCSSLISFGCFALVISGLMSKRKPRSIFSVLGASSLLSFAIINTLVLTNVLSFPTQAVLEDFSNRNVNEAMKWASENNVTLTPKYEYSDSIRKNYVISQSEKGDILAKNIKNLEVIVSDGPNYELEANLPDMVGWDVDRVIKKLKELNFDLETLNIEFNFHDEKRDVLYEQSKVGKMKRNEELTLKFSLGKEEDLKPVELIDLKNKTKFDATLWLKRNGIKYKIEYKFDDNIEKGKVISTDPDKGTKIEQDKTTVIVYISKGAKIVAPDFEKMSLDEIIDWATKNNVNLNYESEYNVDVKAGDIIRVSVKKGTVIEEDTTITVVTSKGPLKMIDFKDDLNKLRSFAEQHNIKLVETQEFNNDIEQGKIIRVSHKPGQIIHTGESIEIVISKGNAVKIPNFIGMTESEARNACSNAGLDCTFSYVYSSRTKGTIIDQNKSVGAEVTKGSNIVLSVSAGKAPSYGGGSSGGSGSNSGGSSGGGNNGGSSTKPKPPVCQNTTLYIYPHFIVIDNPTDTCNNVKNAYQGFKFYCNYVNSDSGKKGQILNSSELHKTTINSCNTVTINIKNN